MLQGALTLVCVLPDRLPPDVEPELVRLLGLTDHEIRLETGLRSVLASDVEMRRLTVEDWRRPLTAPAGGPHRAALGLLWRF